MEKKTASTFIFSVIAIILGVTLFRKFDLETSKFENTGLAIIYIIVFIFSLYVIIKNVLQKQ
jgi:membrane protein DedA with SNARE-associated domain